MELQPGWAEFNDADAIIRGRMVAASGTFSGTFSADNVEAVQEINIRNGAASSYYGFSFPGGSTDISFSIDPQPHTNIADVIVPCSIRIRGKTDLAHSGIMSLYKDGVLIGQERVFFDARIINSGGKAPSTVTVYTVCFTQVIRFIDMGVSSSQPTTYRVVLNSLAADGNGHGYVILSVIGSVVVGVRKR